MPVTSTTLANDQGKFIQDSLIERTMQLHKLPQFGEKVSLPSGMGSTAEFIAYNRTDVPVDKLTEGVTPSETTFTISRQTITVDKWGLFITLTDVGLVTTKHPVLNESIDLVADAIARCQDYNLAEVLADGTNIQYWDGSRANRAAILSTDTFQASVAHKAAVGLFDDGAPGRNGDMYVAVCGAQVLGDVMAEAATVGSWSAAMQQTGKSELEKGAVGDWLGFRWVKSNFLPKYTRIATFSAPTATTGGSLSGTVYHKVTRKSLTRGFEEDIQAEANTVMSANTRLPFIAPSTAGYVYNVYAGSATGDANLYISKENLAPSATFNLDTLATSGANPPATPPSGVTIYPIMMFGAKAMDVVDLNELSVTGSITPGGVSDSDPLGQRRKVGSKYAQKGGIRRSVNFKWTELASAF